MSTVGVRLKTARRQRGLTMEEVATALCIPARQLQLLENDDLSSFTAEVYAQGVFRAYARHVGMTSPEIEHDFARAVAAVRTEVPVKFLAPYSWLNRVLTPRWILAMIGAGAALLVGGYVGWQVQSFLRLPALAVSEPAAAIIKGDRVTVAGRAEQPATVQVNGVPVLLQEDGSFAMQLGLHPGINVVRVEAVTAAQRRRLVERHLLVPRADVMVE